MGIVATTLLFEVIPAAAEGDAVASLLFDVRPDTTTPPHLLFDVTQLVGATDQLQPPPGVRQTVSPELTMAVNGTTFTVHPSDLAAEDIVLNMTPDGSSWSWAFNDQGAGTTRTTWQPPTILWPVQWGTVAPGKGEMSYALRYRTVGLEAFTMPLMAEGITKSNDSDLMTLRCQGVGAEGRWDSAKSSLFLDAGHGLTHGAIAKLVLEGAADPKGNLVIASSAILFGDEIGTPLFNPVDLDCVDSWPTAREIIDQ